MPAQIRKDAARKLTNTLPLLHRKFIRQVKSSFSPLHFATLSLMSYADVYTMSGLAKGLSVSKQQLTPVIEKLCGEGLVAREKDPNDRRHVNLFLTGDGARFLETHLNHIAAILEEKFSALSDADLHDLDRALTTLQRIFHKID